MTSRIDDTFGQQTEPSTGIRPATPDDHIVSFPSLALAPGPRWQWQWRQWQLGQVGVRDDQFVFFLLFAGLDHAISGNDSNLSSR